MRKNARSSIAVSRETAAALKVLADEIGSTVEEMLHVVVVHKPAMLQRAYVQGDRLAKAGRLVELGQRRMAAASGSGSRSASAAASSAPAPAASSRSASAGSAPAASAGSRSASAGSAPAASAGSAPVVLQRPPSTLPRTS